MTISPFIWQKYAKNIYLTLKMRERFCYNSHGRCDFLSFTIWNIADSIFYKEYVWAVFFHIGVEKTVCNKNIYHCKRHINWTHMQNFKFLWQKLWPNKLVQTEWERSMKTEGTYYLEVTLYAFFNTTWSWVVQNEQNKG